MTTPVGEPHFFVTRSWRDLAEGRLPDRQVLDRATTAHPVMIQAWAPMTPNAIAFNTAALRALDLDASTPARVGDVWIEKDASGQPTGILSGSVTNYYSEDAFNESLWRRIPFLHAEGVIPATVRAMAQYNAQGVTAIYENHAMEAPFIEAYRHLRAEGAAQPAGRGRPGGRVRRHALERDQADRYVRARLPSRRPPRWSSRTTCCASLACRSCATAPALRARCACESPTSGPTVSSPRAGEFIAPDRAALAMHVCAESGMRLNTVVMGTRAHEENLAQLEATAARFDVASLEWLLVHAWFLEGEQARRYARLGMHATTSMAFTWGKGRLFRERMKASALADLVPLRRMLDAGLTVGAGSDWGPKSAFRQLELALTHEVAGSDEPNLGPAQRVTREEALAMWTRDAARVLGWSDIGTLAPGRQADIAIVDRDPLRCEIPEISGTVVEATLLGGRLVHGELPS